MTVERHLIDGQPCIVCTQEEYDEILDSGDIIQGVHYMIRAEQMAPTLEGRAAVAVVGVACLPQQMNRKALDVYNNVLEQLRAVDQAATKAAYERAIDKLERMVTHGNYFQAATYDCAILEAIKAIRALADGDSDG